MAPASWLRAPFAACVVGLALLGPPPVAALLGPPVVTSVTLAGLTAGALTPVAGSTVSLTATILVTDPDGFGDISTVTVGILKPDGSVHVAQSAATFVSGTALVGTYTKTLTMNFYDAPALAASTYKVKVVATDKESLTGDNTASPALFNYNQLAALQAPSSFDVGAGGVAPGSAGAITGLSLQNTGNVQVDVQVAGTALSLGANSIPVADISFGTASNLAGSTVLATTAATLSSFDLAPGAASSRTLYLQLTTTPTGLPAGTYTGTLTLTAVAG